MLDGQPSVQPHCGGGLRGSWLPRSGTIPRIRALVVRISWHESDRAPLRPLFSLAESSPRRLDAYLDEGRVLVAAEDAEILGYLQLVECDGDEIELKDRKSTRLNSSH